MKRILAALLFVFAAAAGALAATPTATSFSQSVPANRQGIIQLQGADSDGTALTFATLSAPSHGALSNLNASTGTLVYTPTAGYTGADSFTYKVTSGGQDSSTATVTLSVSTAKTTVTGTFTDASGNPRQGKITFILTQQVTTSAGITPVGSSVSATVSPSGTFSVQLYPSRGMSPEAYYQVWFADSATLNREALGVYEIPHATTPVALSGYKVTDTNLAARYTFVSAAGLEAYAKSVTDAAVALLLAESRTTGKLQYWDGGTLSDSIVSQSGTTVTVAGTINVTGGYVGIMDEDLPASMFDKLLYAPSISGGTATGLELVNPTLSGSLSVSGNVTSTGTVTAAAFVGNGAGLTGITGATGGISNTGSTTARADSDNDGTGVIDLQAKDGVVGLRVNNDASVSITNLLAGYAFPSQFLSDPSFWKYERHASNPLFKVAANPGGVAGETTEQYSCAPVHLGGTTIVAYCKGTSKIYAHVSTDNGATWAVANGGAAVIQPGVAWEGIYTIEPEAMVDGTTIRLWYRGQGGIGYATASTASPYVFTKQGQVLTNVAIGTALGITVGQSGVGTVTKIGSTYYYYLYVTDNAAFGSQTFRLAYATGTATSATVQGAYMECGPKRICSAPTVFRPEGSPVYIQMYVDGSYNQTAAVGDFRQIVTMTSRDGVTWTRETLSGVVLSPAGGNEFDSRQTHFARFLRKPDGAGLEPLLVNDRFQLYYSGQNAGGTISQGGIAYVTPTMARFPALSISGAESNSPRIRFLNSHGIVADGYLSAHDDASGTYPFLGSNLFVADDGAMTRGDASRSGSMVRAMTGEVNVANAGGIPTFSFTSSDSIATPNIQGTAYDLHLNANAKFNGTTWERIDAVSRPAYNIALNPETSGPGMYFRAGVSGTGTITWNTLLKLDGAAGLATGESPALLLIDGSLKRVVAGAADSGGTGFRMLRVAN